MNQELKELIDNTTIENFNINSAEVMLQIIKRNLTPNEIKELLEYVKETF